MSDTIITDLKADDASEVTEIESMCFNCHENGTTRLLLTRIAFFREVIISSFSCPHCGFENSSFDPATRIQDRGMRSTLLVETMQDLNRRVVRPSGSTVYIPEFDASFPTANGAQMAQPEVAAKLDDFIHKLRGLVLLEKPFKVILDDPSGNGCIENIQAPKVDPQLEITSYKRTTEQCAAIGLNPDADVSESDAPVNTEAAESSEPRVGGPVGTDEVLTFNAKCPNCNASSDTNMKLVDIPHFKQIVLMATVCSSCGYKDTEVKSGGGVSPLGRCYRLTITHPTDLSRDILVSETAAVRIPSLELESMGGTLGGRFSTLEGMLLAIRDQLKGANPFVLGDSASGEEKHGPLAVVIGELEKIASGERMDILFELKDPAGNSYLQNLYAPDPDPQLEVVDYERTAEDNDDLGLTDMKTTNYEENLTAIEEEPS